LSIGTLVFNAEAVD